jgi:hypothetical protein
MTLRQFAATLPFPVCDRTLRNWHNRKGRKKLNFIGMGRTPIITAAEMARFAASERHLVEGDFKSFFVAEIS